MLSNLKNFQKLPKNQNILSKYFSSIPQNQSVIGSGQMGTGIAIVAALQAKSVLSVNLVDNESQLKNSKKFTEIWVDNKIKKGNLTEQDKANLLSKINWHPELDIAENSDFIIEAVYEDFNLKEAIFKSQDDILPKHAIMASNTSSISITKLAATTKRPENVIGMHFFNPVPVMRGVELISALQTSAETVNTTKELSKEMGKEIVDCKDMPGFVANRVLMPYLNEAFYCLHEGLASVEDIDKCMKLGTNVPMGPLTLADFIGLDTCLAVLEVLHEGHGDPKFRPCPLLKQYVDAGWLGRKSGRGFYNYKK